MSCYESSVEAKSLGRAGFSQTHLGVSSGHLTVQYCLCIRTWESTNVSVDMSIIAQLIISQLINECFVYLESTGVHYY